MKKSLTATIIKSKKLWPTLCLIAAALVDLVVIVSIAYGGFSPLYYILPAVLLGLDLVYLGVLAAANFRFRYSVKIPSIVEAIKTLAVVAFFVWYLVIFDKSFIHYIVCAIWGLSHLVCTLCWMFYALANASAKDGVSRRLHGSSAAMSIGVCVLLLSFVAVVGFTGLFGQGVDNYIHGDGFQQNLGVYDYSNRTLVYQLNLRDNSYEVVDVLDGKGDSVVVPAMFEGIRVTAVNCSLFTNPTISSVTLSDHVSLTNLEALEKRNADIKVYSDVGETDAMRQVLYREATRATDADTAEQLVSFAHAFLPVVEEDKAFCTFDYDLAGIKFLQEQSGGPNAELPILSTWVAASTNETFDMQAHVRKATEGKGEQFEYLNHQDTTDEEDLWWNYRNNGKRIFVNTVVDGVSHAHFEDVYEVRIADGNDARYTEHYSIVDEHNPSFVPRRDFEHTEDNQPANTQHRYILAGDLDSLLNSIEQRDGFSFEWRYERTNEKDDHHADPKGLPAFDRETGAIDNAKVLNLYPWWQVDAPSITDVSYRINAGNEATAFANPTVVAIYGNDVNLSVTADHVLRNGITLYYKWYYADGTEVLSEASTYTRANANPTQHAGKYRVVVTAGKTEGLTALESDPVSFTVQLDINKKDLHFVWDTPAQEIYSAIEKEVVGHYNLADFINGDETDDTILNPTYIDNTPKDVKWENDTIIAYTVGVQLQGHLAQLYNIVEDTDSFAYTILPYEVSLDWQNTDFVYDRTPQLPEAYITGLGEDDLQPLLTIIGEEVDVLYVDGAVAAYTAAATLDDTNYVLTNATQTFVINPKEVTLAWPEAELCTFVYDALFHDVAATVVGYCEGDEVALDYTGAAVNVGDYTMTATISNVLGNYVFASEPNNTLGYTITPCPIYLVWQDTTDFTYDGAVHTIAVAGEIGKPDNGSTVTFDYAVEGGEDAINAGSYTMVASIAAGSNYCFADDEYGQCGYIIHQCPLTVTADNKTMVYRNAAFDYDDYTVSVAGLAKTDTFGDIWNVIYKGTAKNAVSVIEGGYDIDIELETLSDVAAANYDVTLVSGSLTITPRMLTIRGVMPEDSKVYDKTNYSAFTYTYDQAADYADTGLERGVATGDSIDNILVVTYTGQATMSAGIHVGTHAFQPTLGAQRTLYDNYDIHYVGATITIVPKEVSVTWAETRSLVYNKEQQFITATSTTKNGVIEGDAPELRYSFNTNNHINVGTYIITAFFAEGSDYVVDEATRDTEFYITPATVYLQWPEDTNLTYNGKSQGLQATVEGRYGDEVVTLSYEGYQTDVGSYTMTATLPSPCNYILEGDKTSGTRNFAITKRPLTIIADNKTTNYNAKVYTNFSYTVSGLVDDIDKVLSIEYTDTATVGVDVGTYTIGIECQETKAKYDNYDITFTSGTLTINPKTINLTWQSGRTFGYDGYAKSLTATANGVEAGDTVEIQYDGDASDAGTHTMTATLLNTNYTIGTGATCNYTISKRSLTISAVQATKTYDGQAYNDFAVNTEGLADTDSLEEVITLDFTGTAINKVNAGTYNFSPTWSAEGDKFGNYTIVPKSSTLVISPSSLSLVWSETNSFVYDKTAKNMTATPSGLIGGDSVTITYTYKKAGDSSGSHVNVGTYTVTANLPTSNTTNKNYTLEADSKTCTMTITPAIVTLAWQTNRELTYSGTAQSVTATVEGRIGNESVNLTYTYKQASALEYASGAPIMVGEYKVKATLPSVCNYILEDDATSEECDYTIVPRAITIRADNKTKTYDSAIYDAGYTASAITLGTGDTLSDVATVVFGGDAQSAVDAGTYDITVAEVAKGAKAANYNVTYEKGTLTINQRGVTVRWQSQATFTYDGTDHVREPATFDGRIANDVKFGYNLTGANTSVGSYVANVELTGSNYYLASGGSSDFSIVARAITIRANDQQKTYDTDVFEGFDYTLVNLAEGDDIADLCTFSFEGDALTAVHAGTYPISFSSATQGSLWNNYNITWVSGTLTIAPATIRINWNDDDTITYDGTLHTCTATVTSGVYAGDSVTLRYDGARANVGIGTAIAVSQNSDYVVADLDKAHDFEIVQRDLTVTIGDRNKVFDGETFDLFGCSADGLGIDQTLDMVLAVTYTGEAISATEVGLYKIDIDYTDAGLLANYNVSVVQGTLTIAARKVSVTWPVVAQFVYDGTAQGCLPTFDNTVEGTDIDASYLYYEQVDDDWVGIDGAPADVGIYRVELTGVNANYEVEGSTTCDYTIEVRTVHVQWSFEDGAQFLVDGNPVVLTASFDDIVEGETPTINYQYYRYNEATSQYVEMMDEYPVEAGDYKVLVTLADANYFVQTGGDYDSDELTYVLYTEPEQGE